MTLEEEKSLVDINGGFYLFESAIPITRIKKIYFKKRNQAYRTISNITLSTAFIPSNLIDEKDNTFEKTSDIVHVPEDIVSSVDNIKTRVRDKDCVKNRVKRAKIVRFTLC